MRTSFCLVGDKTVSIETSTHLRALHLENDTGHGKNYPHQEAQFYTDQSRRRHSDQPHNGVTPAGAPLCGNVSELPQRPPKAYDDNAGKNTLLKIVEERCKEEEDEEDDQGADQTRYLR